MFVRPEDRWSDAVVRYRRLECDEDPAFVVYLLSTCEPDKLAPAYVWMAWHEVQADCWARIADRDPIFESTAQFIGGYHREEIRRLASARSTGTATGSRQAAGQ
jgi:hypothetical protein